MPERDPRLLVEDMLAAIRKIERYTSGMSQAMFQQDEKTLDAVVRNLEVVGEAARRVSAGFASRHAEVPWRQVAGLRNRIVHDYFGLDLEIIWQVIRHDLPQLKASLEILESAADSSR
ncbi:MAG TPA: DUF86 domain-containing protein [Thermoanaerobaculia bacterium]|nr:DUF86 domain-containing protein [Thermoanaerobaculia bacterium]